MTKVVALVRRRDDLTQEAFLEHWQQRHSKLVAELPGLRRYVQNPAVTMPNRQWPYDGMVELWFDSTAAVREAFRSPQADVVREDEPRFVKTIDWFLADEFPVVP